MSSKQASSDSEPTAVTSIQIEAIVRRILRQLREEAGSQKPNTQVPALESAFVIPSRLLTMEGLAAVPTPVKQIRLPANGIVTPAAKDELKRRGMTITFNEVSGVNDKPAASRGTLAICLQTDGEIDKELIAAVRRQVSSRGVRLCDEASTRVVLSSRPAVTAHQNAAVSHCVVAISRVDDVARCLADLSPDVFVLDVLHLHIVAITKAIILITTPKIRSAQSPRITVAGGPR